jgi:hypothetical protein
MMKHGKELPNRTFEHGGSGDKRFILTETTSILSELMKEDTMGNGHSRMGA